MNEPMNQDVKKLWVEALRSGQYKQDKGCLEKDGKYCCLGLLSELAVQAGKCTKATTPSGTTEFGKDHEESLLPTEVKEWSGLNRWNPSVTTKDGTVMNLAYRNDIGMTFPELADLIEQHF